jgi:hypothetical protein
VPLWRSPFPSVPRLLWTTGPAQPHRDLRPCSLLALRRHAVLACSRLTVAPLAPNLLSGEPPLPTAMEEDTELVLAGGCGWLWLMVVILFEPAHKLNEPARAGKQSELSLTSSSL